MSDKGDAIAAFAEAIAFDDSHGYSQSSRWGTPDYDCSSLVITAAEYAGISVKSRGASYTGNMVPAFTQAGFTKLAYYNGMQLQRGDILLNIKSHTAVYLGNNMLVEATGDEKGGISGGQPGDQTGHEIHTRLLYNYPWDCVLRWPENEVPDHDTQPEPVKDPDCSYTTGNNVVINGPQIQYGDYGPAVAAAQGALNYHGFGPIAVDGFFGVRTTAAVRTMQTVHQLTVDGIIGPATWRALLYWR